MTRFVVLGNSEAVVRSAKALLGSGMEVAAFISMTTRASEGENLAKQHKIPYHEVDDINSWGSVEILRRYAPDYIIESWPKAIAPEIMKIPKAVIGIHPICGDNSLQWLIQLGCKKSHLCFRLGDEAYIQLPFTISDEDTIADVLRKINDAAENGTKKIARMIKNEELKSAPLQDSKQWRDTTPHDMVIDPRMSGDMIVRIVRSCTRPYACASLIINDSIIKVVFARIAKQKADRETEQGKIMKIEGHILSFKADDAVIEAACENIPEKVAQEKYIHPPSYYIERSSELREKLKKSK
ncbi:MAG TPA: hypothetical protein VJH88_00895 [Candidatus Nanoarchaeia archaeon]|nr:hypothetical protein [Candidatus Nanoarchaeia archaeon]